MIRRPRTVGLTALGLVATVVAVQAIWAVRHEPAVRTRAAARAEPGAAVDLAEPPPATAGFAGPRFDDERSIPTGRTDRSQQWFAGGRWWAVLADDRTGEFHIWALSGPDGDWLDTGVLVEARPDVQPDVVWTGTSLLVVSAGTRSYRSHAARIARFGYDEASARWTPDADFPIAITEEGVGGATLDVTDDGTLWVTYLDEGTLRVVHSDTGGLIWSDPHEPAAASEFEVTDFSATAHGSELTIGWRTAEESALHLARHTGPGDGGSWTTRSHDAHGLAGGGDLVVRDGRSVGLEGVLAVAQLRSDETSGSLEPSISMYRLEPDGSTAEHLVARVADDLAQPRMVLDAKNAEVAVVATSTTEAGTIRATRAPVESLSFGVGDAVTAIHLPGVGPVADPIVGDPPAAEGAGMLVLAAADPARRYVAAVVPLGGPVELASSDAVARIEVATLLHDSFESRPLGSPAPTNWYYRGSPGGGSTTVTTGRDTRAVSLMVDGEGSGHERCRDFPEVRDEAITVEAIVRVEGGGGADARLLTVRGSTGVLASARLSHRGDVGWLTPDGRLRGLRVGAGTPLRVVARFDPATRTYRMEVRSEVTGDPLLQVGDTPWLAGDADAIESVCVTPPDGAPGSAILVDELIVREEPSG